MGRELLPAGGSARYTAGFLARDEADALLAALQAEVPWKQESLTIFGVRRAQPRLTAWYGDRGTTYTYSGIKNAPLPWRDDLRELALRLETAAGARFNSVLLNLYRDGADGVAWHSDDEPELGERPTIASVSLGAERTFDLRYVERGDLVVRIALEHGSLLVMSGDSQRCWKHRVAKTGKVTEPRINLTFRYVWA